MMRQPLDQHRTEILGNRRAWNHKALLRAVYSDLYRRIIHVVDPSLPGSVVEIGSGMGNLRDHLPGAIMTDLFPNAHLHLVCDGYDLPFKSGSLSHLILVDVFHHLEAPAAFLREAHRTLCPQGRVVLVEPFISWFSFPVYGLAHHEAVAWRQPISKSRRAPRQRSYYAAQGNATRTFFRAPAPGWLKEWIVVSRCVWSGIAYLLSGGFSGPTLAPGFAWRHLAAVDRILSRWPSLFGMRCLVCLARPISKSR